MDCEEGFMKITVVGMPIFCILLELPTFGPKIVFCRFSNAGDPHFLFFEMGQYSFLGWGHPRV